MRLRGDPPDLSRLSRAPAPTATGGGGEVTPWALSDEAAQAAIAAVGAVAMQVLKTLFWERMRDGLLALTRHAYPLDFYDKRPFYGQPQLERVDAALRKVWDELHEKIPDLIGKRYAGVPQHDSTLTRVTYSPERKGKLVYEPDWHDDHSKPFSDSEYFINILFTSLPAGEGGEGVPSGTLFREEASDRLRVAYQNPAVGDEVGLQIFPSASTVIDHANPFNDGANSGIRRPAPGRLVAFFRIPTERYHTPQNNKSYRVAVEAIRAALLDVAS